MPQFLRIIFVDVLALFCNQEDREYFAQESPDAKILAGKMHCCRGAYDEPPVERLIKMKKFIQWQLEGKRQNNATHAVVPEMQLTDNYKIVLLYNPKLNFTEFKLALENHPLTDLLLGMTAPQATRVDEVKFWLTENTTGLPIKYVIIGNIFDFIDRDWLGSATADDDWLNYLFLFDPQHTIEMPVWRNIAFCLFSQGIHEVPPVSQIQILPPAEGIDFLCRIETNERYFLWHEVKRQIRAHPNLTGDSLTRALTSFYFC